VVVNSQFGIHIIRIEKQVGNSKIVKAAIVDKVINAGKETTDAAFAKANEFFSEVTAANFGEFASQKSVRLNKADRVQAMDNTLNGEDAPRELFRWIFEADQNQVSDKIYE